MRICILVDDYYPSTRAGAKLVHDLGTELLRQGQDVLIVTPSETAQAPYEIALHDALRVLRVKTTKIKGASKAWRAWGEIRLSSVLWRRAQEFFKKNPC